MFSPKAFETSTQLVPSDPITQPLESGLSFDKPNHSTALNSLAQPLESGLSLDKPNHSTALYSRHVDDLSGIAPLKPPQTDWEASVVKPSRIQLDQSTNSPATQQSTSRKSQVDTLAPTGVNASGCEENWVDKKIQDRGIRSAIKQSLKDGDINRTETIGILNKAKDGGVITSVELQDLRDLMKTDRVEMPDYVRNLAGKVIKGDVANRHYQGETLGNLKAGSSVEHLDKLIGKWFLGSDRPEAVFSEDKADWFGAGSYGYKQINKPLFKDGASFKDVKQGDVGDCYLLSAAAAIAEQSPEQIENMFIDNGDGTHTVRFYDSQGKADYVTVDNYLPVEANGKSAFANHGKELWMALLEKAYAQWNESGEAKQDKTNSYQGIGGGWMDDVMKQFTGGNVERYKNYFDYMKDENVEKMVEAYQSGEAVSLASSPFSGVGIVGNHAYTLVGYDERTEEFTLYNPWGIDYNWGLVDNKPNDGIIRISKAELILSFRYWAATDNL